MSVGIERARAALHYLPAGLSAVRQDLRRSPWLVALAGSGTCGSREQSSAILTHMLRHFRSLVAKNTAPTFVATKWRVCPFCVLGWHHRNGSQAGRVASLGNSESGALASNECSWNVWDKGNRLPMHEIAGSGIVRSK